MALPALAAEIPSAKPEREGMSSERLERVVEMNDRYTDTGKIAGTLTAVVRNGKIVHQSASGLKTVGGEPIEMDDLFRIYSMSKPITSAAIMQLIERGRLGLDDPVAMYIPEFAHSTVASGDERVPLRRPMHRVR